MPTKRVTRKRAKPLVDEPELPIVPPQPKCQKCHHYPLGVGTFAVLAVCLMISLSMFLLTSLSVQQRQAAQLSALLSQESLAQR